MHSNKIIRFKTFISIMKFRIRLALILMILVMPSLLYSQRGKFYTTTDNDLSSSLINQIFQDKDGYIWIATEYGLNKFDGNHFVTYKHDENNPLSLKNNYVKSLFQDRDGNFYVGCVDGLMLYNKAADSFTEIKMESKNKIVSPHLLSFCQLPNKDILIATAGYGIFRLKYGSNKAVIDHELSKRVPDQYVSTLLLASDGTLWIGTENKGLLSYSFKRKRGSYYSYPNLTSDNITCLLENDNNDIIVGTLNNGINVYNHKTKSFSPIKDVAANKVSVKHITKVGYDILIGTDGDGLKRYHDDTVSDFPLTGLTFDFTNAKIHYILSDNENNLWLGVFQKGVAIIPRPNHLFHYWGNNSLSTNPIGKSCVMSVFCDSNDDIWIGCDSEGLFQVGSKGERKRHFSPTSQSDVPKTPLCMFEDSQNNFWVGSYAQGVAIMDRKSGRCNYLPELKGQKVYCITEDNNSNIYIATLGSGFYIYNLKTKKIEQYKYYNSDNEAEDMNGVFYDWINYIHYDDAGYLWIAHYKGISCFDLNKRRFIIHSSLQKKVSNCIAYSILKAENGDTYVGTSNGLYIEENGTEKVSHLSLQDGLPNEIICGITEDSNNNIWMSTYMGICKYETAAGKFINYYAGDGLQGNEFTHGAFCKGFDGSIFFGGVNGITYFLDSDESSQDELNVFIKGFYIYGKKINCNTKSGSKYIINTAVSDAKEFNLSYKDNTFTIVLSTMSYVNQEKIVYQYRIPEMDKKWLSTTPGLNTVTFNSLSPGEYTFEVRAERQGNFSAVKSIKIIISPPWYLSWWSYCLYFAITVGVISIIVAQYRASQRSKREMMKIEHAEQINEAKLQFFINISHEIRTPMTLIISPMGKLLSEVKDAKLRQTYLMVYRNSQRILRLVNQLMDIRKIDKGQFFLKFRETDIIGFIEDVKLTFEYKAKQNNIDFTFRHDMEKLNVWIDLNNFDKIMMNLLSNSFKFTPENGSIDIELKIGSDELVKGPLRHYFQITVTDSGIGLDSEKIDKIFERFYQITNDTTQSNFGTGIGLHMCKTLVELHHGTIKAENRTDTIGSRFILRLPLGSAHLTNDDKEINNDDSIIIRHPFIHNEIEIEEAKKEKETVEKRGRNKSMKSILIIEDDDEIKDYIKDELENEFTILTADNGKEGYDMILKQMPDLIITDVMMPEMDGITLCKKIKQNDNINQIPVIMVTAKSKSEDQIEGFESGADDYIVKPFNIDVLHSKVVNLIKNRSMLKNKYLLVKDQLDKVVKLNMKSSDEHLMEKIINTLNRHMNDPELNVETLAAAVGISRVHIHRKLKELTNMSARDFIKSVRLKQAAEMLSEKKLTIAEVAYAVGYTNPSYFTTNFKEHFGMSPKDYMNKAIEDRTMTEEDESKVEDETETETVK